MSRPAGRRSALVRLGTAYARHLVRRRVRPRAAAEAEIVQHRYAPDRLVTMQPEERRMLPEASGCVNCGLCALAVRRVDGLRPADLASAYLRDNSLLPDCADEVGALGTVETSRQALLAAAAVCPTGVPLDQVAVMVRRFSQR